MEQYQTPIGFSGSDDGKSFLSDARKYGWQEALARVNPYKVCESAAPNRLAWLNLVEITPESRVLDMGAGTGGIACQLAKHCTVEAVDVSTVDIEFLKIRSKQEGLQRFNAQVASATQLPFPNGHFDLVTINGVLEWVPLAEPEAVPQETQVKGLLEARRVLKNGGKLLLGIENGKALRYFLGMTEPHTDLNYVSLLSEDEGEVLSKDIRAKPFLERTYSLKETEDLLRQGGFEHIEPYWIFPDYRLPEAIVPLKHSGAVSYFVQNMLDPQRFNSQCSFVEYLFYRFNDPEVIKEFIGHYCFLCS